MTYYQVLDLSANATPQQIKDAYRELVKEYHPDKNKSEKAKELIVLINEAYEVLSNPEKKLAYDQQLAATQEASKDYHTDREAYRMEYIRKKNLEARKAREKRERFKKGVFTFLKFIHACLLIWAIVLIIDYILPGKTLDEYATQGWQRQTRSKYGTHLRSYIQTPSFTVQVPHELHLRYEYYGDKQLLTIRTSQLLTIPLTVQIHESDQHVTYDVLGTVYTFGLWPALLLLLNTLFVLRSKYNFWSYIAAFTPIFIIIAMII